MRGIRTSGLMSGGWKRGLDYRASLRLYSTPSSVTTPTINPHKPIVRGAV